jgi:hypothetical protein
MAQLNLQKQPTINDGMQITYIGAAGVCTYWEIVAGGVGSLSDVILLTDGDGVTTNQYTSSVTPGDVGTAVTIKVTTI